MGRHWKQEGLTREEVLKARVILLANHRKKCKRGKCKCGLAKQGLPQIPR